MKNILGSKLSFDWKVTIITVVSTLLLTVDAYYPITVDKYWDRVLLYLVIPLIFIMVIFRENPGEYGFTLGDWKAGLSITLACILLMTPILWIIGKHGAGMVDYYQPYLKNLPWNTFLNLIGWEFFFRGWILFGYGRRFGPEAIWLQAVPFALAHIGKPAVETFSTIFGGFAFGWIAWRTHSFLYPFLIHWFVASFIVLVAGGLFG